MEKIFSGILSALDHTLLKVYLVVIVGLLVLPLSEPEFSLLGIKSDKIIHVAMFGGLSVIIRWHLHGRSRPSISAFLLTCAVAVAAELLQGILAYRNAGLADLLAGIIGAFAGTFLVALILHSRRPDRALGLIVILLGLLVGGISLVADIFGIGGKPGFGHYQVIGAALGALLIVSGGYVYLRACEVQGTDANSS